MKIPALIKVLIFGAVLIMAAATVMMIGMDKDTADVTVSSRAESAYEKDSSSEDESAVTEEASEISLKQKALAQLDNTSGILPQTGLENELRAADEDYYELYKIFRREGAYPVYSGAGISYYGDTKEAYDKLLEDLESAEDFIFLEYFIIAEGEMWGGIEDILERKAQQGVTVRVIGDGLYASTNLVSSTRKRLADKGIDVRVFAPFTSKGQQKSNIRDHRKIAVIDGNIAYTGGANLADEYININSPYGYWKDNFIRLEGAAANSFTVMFLQVWNIYGEDEEPAELIREHDDVQGEGYIIPFSDCPFDDVRAGRKMYIQLFESAREYVHLAVPYFIPDSELLETVRECAERGVKIEIVLPHMGDSVLVQNAVRSYYKELIDMGVRVYEYTPGFCHEKICITDGRLCFVGSVNVDSRSFLYDYECGVCLLGCEEIKKVDADFNEVLSQCEEVTEDNIEDYSVDGINSAILRGLSGHL